MRGMVDYQISPFISWGTTCTPKNYRGVGLKNLGAWNKASIAKIVWAIAEKKNLLWVKWLHGRYLRNQDWWDFQASPDCSWYWKKLVATKELFKKGISNRTLWHWHDGQHYTVQSGYRWQLGGMIYKDWSKIIWVRTTTPRHATTA